jgi:iron complex transport system substrate-binding protein
MRLVTTILVLLSSLSGPVAQPTDPGAKSRVPTRIVSLAPSVSELLFALGLGGRVVGVTTYCRYPSEVLALPKIGGYLTPSYEALAAVRPDLAVLLPEHDDVRRNVEMLGIPVLRVDHTHIAGILESATTIGERCGVSRQAVTVRSSLQAGLDVVAQVIA